MLSWTFLTFLQVLERMGRGGWAGKKTGIFHIKNIPVFFPKAGYLQPENSSDTLIYRQRLISGLPEGLIREKDWGKHSAGMHA